MPTIGNFGNFLKLKINVARSNCGHTLTIFSQRAFLNSQRLTNGVRIKARIFAPIITHRLGALNLTRVRIYRARFARRIRIITRDEYGKN